MRLDRETLDQVDRWRSDQHDLPSRAEAVRRLVGQALAISKRGDVRLSGGEKLILMLLHNLTDARNRNGDADAKFVLDTISEGHYWALEWKYPGLFEAQPDSPQVVEEVVEVLEMWRQIEWGLANLCDEDKRRIESEAEPIAKHMAFRGFDGNNEAAHLSIAHFLVEKLGRFEEFKGRDLNSHMPSINAYRRMLGTFAPMQRTLVGGRLGASQIIEILKAER